MDGPLLTNTQKSIFKWYLSLQTLINVDVKLHRSKSSQPQQLGVMTGWRPFGCSASPQNFEGDSVFDLSAF